MRKVFLYRLLIFALFLFFTLNVPTLAQPSISWRYKGLEWSDSDEKIIEDSFNYLSSNINNSKVKQCIRKYTKIHSGVGKMQSWIDYDALARIKKWPAINVIGEDSDGSWNGRARSERILSGERKELLTDLDDEEFDDDDDEYIKADRLSWKKSPTITINLAKVRHYKNKTGNSKASKRFAGTILHEILHQMGHLHPSTGNYEKDYTRGHFVVVAGDCLHTNGLSVRSPASSSVYADRDSDSQGEDDLTPLGGWGSGE
jgi:hypothetical protein